MNCGNRYMIYIPETQNDPCFDWQKDLVLEGPRLKMELQTGSRYT